MSKWLEIFLAVIYTQNMAPHKILDFSDNYFYYYIFFVPCETKYGELHIENNIILHQPPQIFVS